jgi:signal transduction histidine kinase
MRRLWSKQASHRTRIVILVLASGLPVLLLAIFGLWRYLDASKQDLVDDRVAIAQAASLTSQAFVSDITSTAQTLALSPELTDPSRRRALPDLLERVRAANPDWDQIAVLDASGRTLASSGSPPVETPQLQSLIGQVLSSGRVTVGAVVPSPGTGARLLVGIPLSFADGSHGLLLVSPSVRELAAELRAQVRGPQLELAVLDVHGATLIAPPRPASGWISSPTVLNDVANGQVGSDQLNTPDGALLTVFAPVPNLQWAVVIAQPTSVIFAPLERQVGLVLAGLVLALGAAGLMAWALGGRLSLYYERILEARDRAEHATQARDAVLASVSHDLQNPLAAARGHLQLMERRMSTDPQLQTTRIQSSLTQTQAALLRMQHMIQELVDSARIQAGYELSLRPSLTDVRSLVQQVVDEQSVGSSGDRIHVGGDTGDMWVVCDTARIARAVANVLSNALKYSPAEKRVLIDFQRDAEWITLGISDEGIGIPEDELPHLFERFHRARNAASHAIGTGLGLAGVRSIVEQHGGRISIESEEGVGTTVRVRLPRGARAATPEPIALVG